MTTLAHTQTIAAADTNLVGAKAKRVGFVGATAYAVAFIGVITAVAFATLSQARFTPRLAADLMQQSEQLSVAGDPQGAVAASRRASEFYRGLMRVSAIQYPPKMAASLHDLSLRLSEAGDGAGALAAIQEAIEIRRHLAKASSRFAAGLEQSLQLLSRVQTTNRSELPNLQTADNTVRQTVRNP
jgi:hypothetical protein